MRGRRAAVELPLLVALVMFGLVLCANPGRYGATGLVTGALLAGIGALAARRRFHRREQPEPMREI